MLFILNLIWCFSNWFCLRYLKECFLFRFSIWKCKIRSSSASPCACVQNSNFDMWIRWLNRLLLLLLAVRWLWLEMPTVCFAVSEEQKIMIKLVSHIRWLMSCIMQCWIHWSPDCYLLILHFYLIAIFSA